MLEKTIKYTDFNDVEREEKFLFNLTDAELTQLQFSTPGGLEKKLEDIIASEDMKEILSIFKEIILLSYGVKSEDGKRFIKNEQLREEFSQTAAFSELYMELLDDEKAAAFINGIIPKDKRMSKAELDKNMIEAANKFGVVKPQNEVNDSTPKSVDSEVVDSPETDENN